MNISLWTLACLGCISLGAATAVGHLQMQRSVTRHRSIDWAEIFSAASPTVELYGVHLGHDFLKKVRAHQTPPGKNDSEPLANEDLLNFHNSQVVSKTC